MQNISRRLFARWAALAPWSVSWSAAVSEASAAAQLPVDQGPARIATTENINLVLQQVMDAADAAISASGVADFASKAVAEDSSIPFAKQFLRLAGYARSGDGGGALYKKADTEPGHHGKFQSADGAWWELAEEIITPNMLGGDLASVIEIGPNGFVPAGTVLVDKTIAYPKLTPYGGGALRGQGMETSNAFSPRATSSKSTIVWNGIGGGSLMELDGQLGLLFEQLSFVGKPSLKATSRAGICHHWLQTTKAFGSGESLYVECSFQHFDTAVKFANSRGDATCAGMHFLKCVVQNVDTFIHVMNDQGLNFVLDHVSCNFIDRVTLFERGGNVDVRNGNLAGCGIINWCFELAAIGNNLYVNSFRNVRIEQGTKRLLKMIGSGSVIFDGLTEAQPNQNVTMFEQTGGVLSVRNAHLTTNSAANPTFIVRNQDGGSRGILFLENVHFAENTFVLTHWIGRPSTSASSIVVMKNCTHGTNFQPIPDFSTDLAYGNPRTCTQTTTDSSKPLTFGGEARGLQTVVQLPTDTLATINIVIEGVDGARNVVFSGVRRAACLNNNFGCTLISLQMIGSDYDPLALEAPPQVSVSRHLNAVEVTVTGLRDTLINWTAIFEGQPRPI
ncbi:hypothetical protein NKI72_26810 [Mesorhizobium sp. M0437]|uniref:hypothetical protein n=1 Tax=Mesorhizobium sp. M0437 TaxID=2956945 RepID=UPI0033396D25